MNRWLQQTYVVEGGSFLPAYPAMYFLDTVKELGGCPVELVTDLGTENSLLASTQSYFQENPDAHRYVPSPPNQRIERMVVFYFPKTGQLGGEICFRT